MGNLRQTFPLSGIGIAPSGAMFKLVQYLSSGLAVSLGGKFVPQVFDQLKTLKLSEVLEGFEG